VSAACTAWWKSSLHCPSRAYPPRSRRPHQARVVQIALGDEQRLPAEAPSLAVRRLGDLLEDVAALKRRIACTASSATVEVELQDPVERVSTK